MTTPLRHLTYILPLGACALFQLRYENSPEERKQKGGPGVATA